MKGISPLVAAVLLIAVTMTIAGMLAYWASSFVGTSLPELNDTNCRFANFAVYSCSFSNSTNQVNLILENREDVALTNLRVFVVYQNGSIMPEAGIVLNGTLEGNTLRGHILSDISANYSKFEIRTQCPQVIASSGCR